MQSKRSKKLRAQMLSISELRARGYLTRDNVAQILINLGYKLSADYKFKIRDERTPSASVDKNGRICDFGGSFSGSIFDFLKDIHGLTPKSANELLNELCGTKDSNNPAPLTFQPIVKKSTHPQARQPQPPQAKQVSAGELAELNRVANELSLNALALFNKAHYIERKGEQSFYERLNGIDVARQVEAFTAQFYYGQSGLFNSTFLSAFAPKGQTALSFLILRGLLGYDFRRECLAWILRDERGIAKAIAYNQRAQGLKWLRAKNSDNSFIPRQIRNTNAPIFIAEGVSEIAIFSLLDFDFICLQNIGEISKASKGTSANFNELLPALKDRKIAIIADNDALEQNKALAEFLNANGALATAYYFSLDVKGYDLRDFTRDYFASLSLARLENALTMPEQEKRAFMNALFKALNKVA